MLNVKLLITILLACIVTISVYFLLQQSIRLDEAQSIWVSTKSIPTILTFVGRDVHVPLYWIILHFYIQIFGVSLHYIRLLSTAFFLFSVFGMYLLAKYFRKDAFPREIIALYALSPFVLWYATEARMYMLLIAFTVFNHLFFLRIISSHMRKGVIGYVVTLLGGVYSHYFFLLIVFTQLLYVIGIGIRSKEFRRTTLFVITLMTFSILLFVPWIFYVVVLGGAANTKPLLDAPTTYSILDTYITFFSGYQQQSIQGILISLWPLVSILLIIFSTKQNEHIPNRGYLLLSTGVPVAVTFIASFLRPIFLSRYLIIVLPSVYLLSVWYIRQLPHRLHQGMKLLLFFFIILFLFQQIFFVATPTKENFQGVARYLTKEATPQDIIFITPPFTIYPIEYSYAGTTRLETIPTWNRFTQNQSIQPFNSTEFSEQMSRYANVYQRAFIVFSYNQGYEEDIESYLDSTFELVERIHFPPSIRIKVYKLRYP